MANLRPPVDAVSGEIVDATDIGANATVETFVLTRGEDTLRWTGTYGANDGAVHSANKVAADLSGGFMVSNDHSAPSMFWPPFHVTIHIRCMLLTICHSWPGMKLPNSKLYLCAVISNTTLINSAAPSIFFLEAGPSPIAVGPTIAKS